MLGDLPRHTMISVYSLPSVVFVDTADLFVVFVARAAQVPTPPAGDTEIFQMYSLGCRGVFWDFQRCMISQHMPFNDVPKYSMIFSIFCELPHSIIFQYMQKYFPRTDTARYSKIFLDIL